MRLLSYASELESNAELHASRLLVLLGSYDRRHSGSGIEGLTKLAKLDFLVRYPLYLERALAEYPKLSKSIAVKPHERQSVESTMVRYRYGPWDFRYRQFLNDLIARGLVVLREGERTFEIQITERGRDLANELAKDKAYSDIATRADLVSHHFDFKGSYLAKLIYKLFPEIGSLKFGKQIT